MIITEDKSHNPCGGQLVGGKMRGARFCVRGPSLSIFGKFQPSSFIIDE